MPDNVQDFTNGNNNPFPNQGGDDRPIGVGFGFGPGFGPGFGFGVSPGFGYGFNHYHHHFHHHFYHQGPPFWNWH